MNEITLAVHDGKITTTSTQVADHFGKRHDDVLRRIRAIASEAGEGGLGYFAETPYIDPQNGQSYPAFEITRDGFALLAMGFTGKRALKFKLDYIAAFNAMEAKLTATTQPALSHLITIEQAGELATLIAERFPDGKDRPYAWSRFNNHFRLSGYKTLPATKFADACEYIKTMPSKEQAALPAPDKLTPNLRNRISRRAHELSLRQYEAILSHITERIELARDRGFDESKCEEFISNTGGMVGDVTLVNSHDITTLADQTAEMIDAAGKALASIHRLEAQLDTQIYTRIGNSGIKARLCEQVLSNLNERRAA